MNKSDIALEKKESNVAAEHCATAQRIVPDNSEMAFSAGVTLGALSTHPA
jgi:hypothetical protein